MTEDQKIALAEHNRKNSLRDEYLAALKPLLQTNNGVVDAKTLGEALHLLSTTQEGWGLFCSLRNVFNPLSQTD